MLRKLSNLFSPTQYDEIHGSNHAGQVGDSSKADGKELHELKPESQSSDAKKEVTVEHAIDDIGFGNFQLMLSLFVGLILMGDSMVIMVLNIIGPAIQHSWFVLPWQQAFLLAAVFAGMMISAPAWGKLGDNYSRRNAVFICCVFSFFYSCLSAASPNYVWLLILRTCVGCASSGLQQIITLYSEFLPTSNRATCIILVQIFWTLGICILIGMAIVVMPTVGWRCLIAFAAFPFISFFCGYCILPNTPRYDITRGKPDLAQSTIERVARINKKPIPSGTLLKVSDESHPVNRGRFRYLLAPNLCRTTLLLWFIWFTKSFAYFGLPILTTQLFKTGHYCPVSVPSKYEVATCRLDSILMTRSDFLDMLMTTLAEIPGLLITAIIAHYLGRRATMGIEFIIYAIFIMLIVLCVSRPVLTAFLLIARAFIAGCLQVSYVYTAEVYPTSIRAIGLGAATSVGRLGSIATTFVSEVVLQYSIYLTMGIYAFLGLAAGICSFLLPIETKGREMQDVPNGGSNDDVPEQNQKVE